MTVTSTNPYSAVTGTGTTTNATDKTGFAALGQKDFFRLLTTQMQMQDPFDPVDNKEMLAQMAQFSSLAGISDMGSTLNKIAEMLDALINQQKAAGATTAEAATDTTATDTSAAGAATTTESPTTSTDAAASGDSATGASDAAAAATQTTTETPQAA